MAVAQNNSGRLISVEPDHVVWAVGEFNKVSVQVKMANYNLSLSFKLSHNCVGYSVLGVLGTADIWMDDYMVMIINDDDDMTLMNNTRMTGLRSRVTRRQETKRVIAP